MKIIIPLLILFSIQTASADVPPEQKPEVEHLLKFVSQSDCVMVRNGSEHIGEKAVRHIQKKYDYFEDDIETSEMFIEYSATKSTMSGKYYMIRCPGKDEIRAQEWLLQELEEFRNKNVEGHPETE